MKLRAFFLSLIFQVFLALCFCPEKALVEDLKDKKAFENLKINHTDLLEFSDNLIFLKGNVSITWLNENKKIDLLSPELFIHKKQEEFSLIQTKQRSLIKTAEYSLEANKFLVHKNPKTKEFDVLEAIDQVLIKDQAGKKTINSEQAFLYLKKEILEVIGNVVSQEVRKNQAQKKELIIVKSPKQVYKITKNKQKMIAEGGVLTELDSQENFAKINSQRAEFEEEKAVFKKDVEFFLKNKKTKKQDNTQEITGKSSKVEYLTQKELIKVYSDQKILATVKTKDNTQIKGKTIVYYLRDKILQTSSSKPGKDSRLSLPVQDKKTKKIFDLKIFSCNIDFEQKPKENIDHLSAYQNYQIFFNEAKKRQALPDLLRLESENNLDFFRKKQVKIEYKDFLGFANNLEAFKSRTAIDKKNKAESYALLVGNALLIDKKTNRILRAPVLKLNIDSGSIQSGFSGRNQGIIDLSKEKKLRTN